VAAGDARVRQLSLMNKKILLLSMVIVCSSAATVAVNAQKPIVIRGGKFCESYLLKKVAKEKVGGSRMVKLKALNPHDKTFSRDLKEWLTNMRQDVLIAFELRNKERKALILGSTPYGATGLATELEYWHIEADGTHSATFWSFSENPSLVFWDKSGSLNYYSVVYSSEWMQDWENLTVDLERYRITPDGSTQLVSKESNVKCE
jgi:hypothetical protein